MRTFGKYFRAIVSLDSESNVPVEYCLLFAVIALFLGMRGFAESCYHPACSAAAVTIPASALRPVSAEAAQLECRDRSDASVANAPTRPMAGSGLDRDAATTPDLVPTALSFMGNVVYLHASSGRLLLQVGNLSSSGIAMTLDPTAMPVIEHETGLPGVGNFNLVNDTDDRLISVIECPIDIETPESAERIDNDTSEVLPSERRRGYKQRVRNQTVKIDSEKYYSPGEVAAAMNVSYDTALRRMAKMKGLVNLGTPTRRYKRGKRKLRVSGRNLLAFLGSKTIV